MSTGDLPPWPEVPVDEDTKQPILHWPNADIFELELYYRLQSSAAIARLRKAVEALRTISNADPANVRSPIGPLHAAGIVEGWRQDKAICDEALALIGDIPEAK